MLTSPPTILCSVLLLVLLRVLMTPVCIIRWFVALARLLPLLSLKFVVLMGLLLALLVRLGWFRFVLLLLAFVCLLLLLVRFCPLTSPLALLPFLCLLSLSHTLTLSSAFFRPSPAGVGLVMRGSARFLTDLGRPGALAFFTLLQKAVR